MTLRAVKGGWINTDFEQEYEATYHTDRTMITQERKSKYKHKITISSNHANSAHQEMREWCEQSYGPSGRRNRWRFGWTDKNDTYYFRSGKDAMMFTLRWSS
jgi:hypothetical protein